MAFPSRTAALTKAGAVRAVCSTILSIGVCMDSSKRQVFRLFSGVSHREQLPTTRDAFELVLASTGEGQTGAAHQVVDGP